MTEALEGDAAIVAMAERLRYSAPCSLLAEPALERLRVALDDSSTTSLDHAVLLRHALRFASLIRNAETVFVDPTLAAECAAVVDLETRPEAGGRGVTAQAWQPAWLAGSTAWPTDETPMRARRCRFFESTKVPADPFMAAISRATYRSAGQRDALRHALSMPEGAALAVDLPTGEGKSSVFSVIDAVGFASDPPSRVRGTTLVIVPTVTLALDHERNNSGTDHFPLAYVGGNDSRNAAIRSAIDKDAQGLCFASPEAVVGSLRNCIGRAAERGTLRAVVIDEAHLVEGWGTGFRTEFQTISGVIQQWLAACPDAARFRILLLSATLTESAQRTLADLFATDATLPVVSAARVRPEIEYWVAEPCTSAEREERVMEAILRLPRPAIIYVTKVDDAKDWHARLREKGFGRLDVVHGRTSSADREGVLRAWSEGRLDLVVATSAFGLGVDYPHVRAVIHACVPESFDRFYQEAGRAGRDGRAAISLLVPAFEDFDIAKGLAQEKVITVKRGFERWQAMFSHSAVIRHGHPRYGLRLNVAPGASPEDIDLVGQRSVDWNARVLALMMRAGLLRLVGVPETPAEETEQQVPYMDVEILDESHLNIEHWQKVVEPKRREIAAASQGSLDKMFEFAAGQRCPGRMVAAFYRAQTRHVAVECGGCAICRADPAQAISGQPTPAPRSPWPLQALQAEQLAAVWGQQRRLLVSYPGQAPSRRMLRELKESYQLLDRLGLRLAVILGSPPEWLCEPLLEAVHKRPWVVIRNESYAPARWPVGARLVIIDDNVRMDPAYLYPNRAKEGMIIIAPETLRDPTRCDRSLFDVAACQVLDLDGFLSRLLS